MCNIIYVLVLCVFTWPFFYRYFYPILLLTLVWFWIFSHSSTLCGFNIPHIYPRDTLREEEAKIATREASLRINVRPLVTVYCIRGSCFGRAIGQFAVRKQRFRDVTATIAGSSGRKNGRMADALVKRTYCAREHWETPLYARRYSYPRELHAYRLHVSEPGNANYEAPSLRLRRDAATSGRA